MPIYNLIEYSDAYSKISGSLCQYYRGEAALDNNNKIIDFSADNNNSASFKFKQRITGERGNNSTKDVEILIPLKCPSNLWRALKKLLINCEISLQLKLSKNCILVAGTAANQNPEFEITDLKLYVPDATLPTQDNIKFRKQLESGFDKTINWNKYLPN